MLRRLTVNYPPIMFHPLNTITAYKGQIIYDTPATEAKSETPVPELTWVPAGGGAPVGNPADLQSLLVPRRPVRHRPRRQRRQRRQCRKSRGHGGCRRRRWAGTRPGWAARLDVARRNTDDTRANPRRASAAQIPEHQVVQEVADVAPFRSTTGLQLTTRTPSHSSPWDTIHVAALLRIEQFSVPPVTTSDRCRAEWRVADTALTEPTGGKHCGLLDHAVVGVPVMRRPIASARTDGVARGAQLDGLFCI